MVCDDCHAELALNEVERSRQERMANMMRRTFKSGLRNADEAGRL
jgi:hypothetical protein